MIWTFYDLEIFIHHACSPTPFDRASAPAYDGAVMRLMDYGLLSRDEEGIIRSTEKGDAWGDMLKSTPLPVHRFIDPRFDRLEK